MKTLVYVSLGLLLAAAPGALASEPAPFDCDMLQHTCDNVWGEVTEQLEPLDPVYKSTYQTAFCTAAFVDPTETVNCPSA